MIRMEWHDVDALTRRFEAGTLDVVFSLEDSGLSMSGEADHIRVARCRLVLAAAEANPPGWGRICLLFLDRPFSMNRRMPQRPPTKCAGLWRRCWRR